MKAAIAAIAFALLIFSLAGCAGNEAANQAPTGGAQVPQPAEQQKAAVKPVRVEFLYADWCAHCVSMKPVVEKAAAEFGSDVQVVLVDEARRKNETAVADLYAKYKKEQIFGGFPTLVANGNSSLVGERSGQEVKGWLCRQFEAKPKVCA